MDLNSIQEIYKTFIIIQSIYWLRTCLYIKNRWQNSTKHDKGHDP